MKDKSKQDKNKEILQWNELARKDLEASQILYANKMYPQAMYFLQQSVEKLSKGLLIYKKCIKNGMELRHNLKLGVSKFLKSYVEKDLNKILDSMDASEKEKLKDKSNRKKFFQSEALKDIKGMAGISFMLEKGHFGNTDLAYSLEQIEKRFDDFINVRNERVKFSKKFEKALKSGSTFEYKALSLNLIDKLSNEAGYKICYALSVSTYLSLVMPEQNTFRYPEFKPLETYNETNELVKNYNKLSMHVNMACKSFEDFILDRY